LELMVPNMGTMARKSREAEVTIARNCQFPAVRIYVFEAKRLSL
jgi:hypothetical protein